MSKGKKFLEFLGGGKKLEPRQENKATKSPKKEHVREKQTTSKSPKK